jgi:hypothetical protein
MERWLTGPNPRWALVEGAQGAMPPAGARQPTLPQHLADAARDRARTVAGIEVAAVLREAYARYLVHPSGQVRIQIVDARTNEVIREIPPEQVVRIAEELQAYLRARRAVPRQQGGTHG